MTAKAGFETFAALDAVPFVRHAFTQRVPHIDVQVDRELALRRLDAAHTEVREALGLPETHFVFAEQVHGCNVAVVDSGTPVPVRSADGLITATAGVCLGIQVADCAPVYLVDRQRRVIALLHSGRKGTEQGIAGAAIAKMRNAFGCEPVDLVVQLGPCIRPPHYEVDFAAEILRQCREAGAEEVHDCGTCTACNLSRYYSYRAEQGKTGRMLALLCLTA